MLFCMIVVGSLPASDKSHATSHAKTITDEAGRIIEIKSPFRRIVSLYAGHTENLFSLGLDKEIAGVSGSEDFPEAALKKPSFDYRIDAEHILAARPDLVLIRPMIERSASDLVSKLEGAGIRVVSLQPSGIEETFSYWKKLGILTGKEKEADAMTARFNAELSEISVTVSGIPAHKRRKVYFESIHGKMKTFAPGSTAIFALETAGGINVAEDAAAVRNTNIAAYGKERILSHADEIDVYLAQKGAMNRIDTGSIRNEPGFAAIKAVRLGEVFLVDESIVSRPTPRLADGIRTIGRLLYPEYFPGLSNTRQAVKKAGNGP